MFKHYWPEENMCDKCGIMSCGSMLYLGNIPVSFICESCDPKQRIKAIGFSLDISNEEPLNGWEWTSLFD